MRQARHGDALYEPPTRSEKFWQSVDKSGECWVWRGPLCNSGYGKFGRPSTLAHRFAWIEQHGPTSLQLDHLCRNRVCVRPSHLEPVSAAENMRRSNAHNGRGSAKTACPQGHLYSPENTYTYRGSRHCRACQKIRQRIAGNTRRKGT